MKVDVATALFAVDRALDREIDRLAGRFLGAMSDVNRKWQRGILRGIDLLDRRGIALASTARNVARARKAEQHVRSALAQSGYSAVAQQNLDQFPDIVRHASRGLRLVGLEPTLGAFDANMLGVYRDLKVLEFQRIGEKYATTIGGTITRAVVAGQSVTELVAEAQEHLQAFAYETRTHFETAAAEFAQTLTLLKTGAEHNRVYLYSGPIDHRIRPFCLGIVGRVYSRERIDRMDNKQLPNSFLSRGGYNCRHQWRDVTAIPDLARLADTNIIVNEHLAGQVAAMRGFLKVGGRQKGVRLA